MKVGILMGSISDSPIIEKSVNILKKFGVEYEVIVSSAHRTPQMTMDFVQGAENRGIGVFIAAAGKAAHLPGVVAAYTTLPVIGLPIKSSTMDGLDSLLSIVQMPKGVPVATVAIDGAENAAILAVQILAVSDEALKDKLCNYKEEMKKEVIESNNKLGF